MLGLYVRRCVKLVSALGVIHMSDERPVYFWARMRANAAPPAWEVFCCTEDDMTAIAMADSVCVDERYPFVVEFIFSTDSCELLPSEMQCHDRDWLSIAEVVMLSACFTCFLYEWSGMQACKIKLRHWLEWVDKNARSRPQGTSFMVPRGD